VDISLTRRKGSIAFVDVYTRWSVGSSAEANTTILQQKVIPRALEWAAQSGAAFEAEKTSSSTSRGTSGSANFPRSRYTWMERTVTPVSEAKIHGVVLDQGLRFKSYIGKAANKGMKAVLALRRLHRLPPLVARELFTSTVTSKIDYAASVWGSIEELCRVSGDPECVPKQHSPSLRQKRVLNRRSYAFEPIS